MAPAARDRHGYSILQDISGRTEGRDSTSSSTLYVAIRRMMDTGFIEELADRPGPESDDQRRRYYRITDFGRRVAIAEARRLGRLLSAPRAAGLAPKRP